MKLLPNSFFRKIRNIGIAVMLMWLLGTIVAWTIAGPNFLSEAEIMDFASNLSFTGMFGFCLILIGFGKGNLFGTVEACLAKR